MCSIQMHTLIYSNERRVTSDCLAARWHRIKLVAASASQAYVEWRWRSIVMSTYVCVSVCLSATICPEPQAWSLPIFLWLLPIDMARSFSGIVTKSQGEGAVLGFSFPTNVSIDQTLNHTKFRCAATRSVWDICCRKFVVPQKWTKVHQNMTWSATHKCPSCQISSHSAKRCATKALQLFYTLQYFGAPGDSWANVHQSWFRQYSKAPSINLPNFVPLWKPVYEISSAKVRRFRWRRDRQKQ